MPINITSTSKLLISLGTERRSRASCYDPFVGRTTFTETVIRKEQRLEVSRRANRAIRMLAAYIRRVVRSGVGRARTSPSTTLPRVSNDLNRRGWYEQGGCNPLEATDRFFRRERPNVASLESPGFSFLFSYREKLYETNASVASRYR